MQSQNFFIIITMDSFRVYLPSNASMDVFPDNKPSDYRVQMNPPLNLEGKWEVGVENVCYHSAIANLKEMERVTLLPRTYDPTSMNELFDYPYVLTKDGKWNYEWIQLNYNDNDGRTQHVIDSLNSGNRHIMKNKRKRVYKFYLSYWSMRGFYTFKSYSSGFAMRMDSDLLKHLGFGHSEHVFTEGKGNVQKVKSKKLTKSNFRMKIFDSNIIECEERIILKKQDEKALSLTEIVKRWNESVGKKYGETAEAKSNKFILNKYNDKLTVFFSPSSQGIVRHYTPIIGSGTFWASHAYTITKESNDVEWYVDIYGDRIKSIRHRERDIKSVIDMPVREFSTVQDVINTLNPHIVNILQMNLPDKYNPKQYNASFSIENQRTILKLGSEMKIELSDYFAKLFGFAGQKFSEPITVSSESPMTLGKLEQRLCVQSDLITPIAYGDKKEYVLREFIHNEEFNYGIMEKLFQPILYQPVVKQNISTIFLRITNGLRESIHLRDTKTLITLIFRRVK